MEAVRDADEDAWVVGLRASQQQFEGYRARRYIDVAAEYGVKLERLPYEEYQCPAFTWWPGGESGPEVLLVLMGFNWRIIESAGGGFCGRSWCIPGNGEVSFRLALIAMLGWRGDRDSAPAVYVKTYGGPDDYRLLHITAEKLIEELPEPITVAAAHIITMDAIIRQAYKNKRNPWDPTW